MSDLNPQAQPPTVEDSTILERLTTILERLTPSNNTNSGYHLKRDVEPIGATSAKVAHKQLRDFEANTRTLSSDQQLAALKKAIQLGGASGLAHDALAENPAHDAPALVTQIRSRFGLSAAKMEVFDEEHFQELKYVHTGHPEADSASFVEAYKTRRSKVSNLSSPEATYCHDKSNFTTKDSRKEREELYGKLPTSFRKELRTRAAAGYGHRLTIAALLQIINDIGSDWDSDESMKNELKDDAKAVDSSYLAASDDDDATYWNEEEEAAYWTMNNNKGKQNNFNKGKTGKSTGKGKYGGKYNENSYGKNSGYDSYGKNQNNYDNYRDGKGGNLQDIYGHLAKMSAAMDKLAADVATLKNSKAQASSAEEEVAAE